MVWNVDVELYDKMIYYHVKIRFFCDLKNAAFDRKVWLFSVKIHGK
jgi:hypothetical protein